METGSVTGAEEGAEDAQIQSLADMFTDPMESQTLTEGPQEPSPPAGTERSTPSTLTDTLPGSSQQVIRQSWTPHVTQDTDEQRSETPQKVQPVSEQAPTREPPDIPPDGVSPSPELGTERRGRPGQGRRMPSLTRKPQP